jgi:hypothetical protein|nr:MAG TPA: hypothetical protein [Caudoviricetes sp.]
MSEEIKQNDSELDSLIKTKLDEAVTSPTAEDGSAPLVVDDTKTPLQQMQEYNEKNQGLVINKADYTSSDGSIELKGNPADDRRDTEYDEYMKEMDDMIETAQSVKVTKAPQNPIEMAAMIDQLDTLTRQRRGDKIEKPVDRDGNVIERAETELTPLMVNGEKTTFFDTSASPDNKGDDENTTENGETAGDPPSDDDIGMSEEDLKHEKMVNIIIDKTGIGVENRIEFSEEEKEKLSLANEIRVTTVETLELESCDIVAPDKSFVENIDASEITIGNTIVPCVSSGYKATMKGAGYGQLGDLLINPQTSPFDKYYKAYSIIYNCLVNTTIGKFNSFDEFLKKTSWLDMNVLLYGIIVSTFPEIDGIQLTCERCRKSFEHKYVVRDLFDIRAASTAYLEKFDQLLELRGEDVMKFNKEAPIYHQRLIKLPNSNWIIKCGISTAYDYLYQRVNNVNNEDWAKTHPDDVNQILYSNAEFVSVVRGIGIPRADGKIVMYEGFDDIINAIYKLPADDMAILNSVLTKFYMDYFVTFSIKNTKCPNCGNTADTRDVDLYQLVFIKLQLLMSTAINTELMPRI